MVEAKNIFITGAQGVGKSTLLKKVIKNIDCIIGGFMQEKIFTERSTRFNVVPLCDHKKSYTIGVYDRKKASMVIDINSFNIISEDILQKSFNSSELIVLDELGFMEEDSKLFKSSVLKILSSNKPVLGVLKDCDTNFINKIKIRKDVQVIKIDKANRDFMEGEILSILENNHVNLRK
jgi:nucleoside-triphosphatase